MLGEGAAEEDREALERLERDAGLLSVAMAVENLLLAAPALGLGATVMTGPLLAQRALREILAVKPGWELVAVVPVGFPDEAPEPKPRKGVEQVIRWIE
jgi:nitroreductase